MNKKTIENNKLMRHASHASIAVAVSLIILKAITFILTGSVSILSGLFDSIQDMMTSFVNMIAIRHATEPADGDHRFGHGKAQGIGSLTQAFIILAAAVFLMIESIKRFRHPEPLSKIHLGLFVTVFAIIVTFVLIRFQSYVIRRTGSLSIKADQAHYTGDILMNVGIIVSMAIAHYLNWLWIDALFGVGVSVYLIIVVIQIIRDSIKMLMDTEMPADFRQKITDIVHSFPEVLSLHDLRTRQSGSNAFVQFCIHLDEHLTLRQAHNITDMIEDRIKESLPDTEIMIHPEPERNRQ